MTKPILTQQYLKEALHYDPETGIFTWKERPREHFNCDRGWRLYLTKSSGKEAGYNIPGLGYRVIRILKRIEYLHRMAFLYMNGSIPDQVDHINHDGSDNRWINLRAANYSINTKNRSIKSCNKSGVTGVCFEAYTGKWKASINGLHAGKHINLGRFSNIDDAIKARKKAEIKYGYHPNHGI